MRRIVRRLHRAQLFATVAVVIAATVAFVLLALVSSSQQATMETDEQLDHVQAQIVQIGAIHNAIATNNTIDSTTLTALTIARAQIDTELERLSDRSETRGISGNLDTAIQEYFATLDTLVAAADDGTLASDGTVIKEQAAQAVINVGLAIREARAELSADSANSWRATRVGFVIVITFLVVSILIITTITEHRLRRALLDRERDRLDRERQLQFAALIENISDAIVVLDPVGQITYASPAAARVFGHHVATLNGRRWVDLLHRDDISVADHTIRSVMTNETGHSSATLVVRIQDGIGTECWIEATATNHRDINGINGIVINARDITERRLAEDSLRFHASHDPLTGLANRTILTEHIEQALQHRHETGETFAVMFIDLDDFKYVNDTWGHASGDDLIVTVSARLRSILRPGDIAARLGGDEFVLVINHLSDDDAARAVAERVHDVLADPFQIGTCRFHVSASLGIAIAGRCADETIDDILRDADIAMYRAKREGRNRTHLYTGHSETGRLIPISA